MASYETVMRRSRSRSDVTDDKTMFWLGFLISRAALFFFFFFPSRLGCFQFLFSDLGRKPKKRRLQVFKTYFLDKSFIKDNLVKSERVLILEIYS